MFVGVSGVVGFTYHPQFNSLFTTNLVSLKVASVGRRLVLKRHHRMHVPRIPSCIAPPHPHVEEELAPGSSPFRPFVA